MCIGANALLQEGFWYRLLALPSCMWKTTDQQHLLLLLPYSPVKTNATSSMVYK
jgi:hypothetical protein